MSNNIYITDTDGYRTDELTKKSDGTYSLKSNGKTFTYNKDKKLSVVTNKTGQKIKIVYGQGQIDLIDDVSGQKLSLVMDTDNRVTEVKNEAETKATFTYNGNGMISEYVDIDGYKTSYTYNEQGQIDTEVTYEDDKPVTKFKDVYKDGRVIEQTDAMGKVARFEYNAASADGTRTSIAYNRYGKKKVFVYDSNSQLISFKSFNYSNLEDGKSKEVIIEKIIKRFDITEDKAKEYVLTCIEEKTPIK